MTATALIRFTQGPNTDSGGVAVIGTLTDGACTITNANNADVESWKIEMLYSPPGSSYAIVPGTPELLDEDVSTLPSAAFTPDVPGCYRIRMTVRDSNGVPDVDIRNFAVLDEHGIIIPPYQELPEPLPVDVLVVGAKPDELNFESQPFGWLGDNTVKLHYQFFRSYKDVAVVNMITTPVTFTSTLGDILRVMTTTIGGASVVNMSSSSRIGQRFIIADGQSSAATNSITVNLPGGHTFEDGSASKSIRVNGGMLEVIFLGSSKWKLLIQTGIVVPLIIIAGDASEDATAGYVSKGDLSFNISDYPPGTVVVFRTVLSTTDVANSADVQLWNRTDSVEIVAQTSTSLDPEDKENIVVLPAGKKVYQVRLKMGSGVAPEFVTCSHARLDVIFSG